MLKATFITLLSLAATTTAFAQTGPTVQTAPAIMLPGAGAGADAGARAADAYPTPNLPDRITFVAPRPQRGTTVPIPEEVVIKFCSGKDGCSVRLGMHNWDDTGRVASREFLFFYNKDTGVWRASTDAAATNQNNVTDHVYQAWSCYFTDGQFENWQNKGDTTKTFGLLSWNEYNADCYITFIR